MEQFGRNLPHVLVSDIAMPDEDGFNLIRQVRELATEHGGAVPAIAVTAYAREEDRLHTRAAGFQEHLTKPINPGDLISAIARLAQPRSETAIVPGLRCG